MGLELVDMQVNNVKFGNVTEKDRLMSNVYDIFIGVPDKEEIVKPVNYIVASNGIFVVRKSVVGIAGSKASTLLATTEEMPEKFFKLLIPKIPLKALYMIFKFFKDICIERGPVEAIAFIYFDRLNNKFYTWVPEHDATGGSIKYDDPEIRELESKYIRVMEIHSHNTMAASFSPVDNSDEKADRLFGVIGQVTSDKPQINIRTSCEGNKIELDLNDVFDDKIPDNDDYPEVWKDKCKNSPMHVHKSMPTFGKGTHVVQDNKYNRSYIIWNQEDIDDFDLEAGKYGRYLEGENAYNKSTKKKCGNGRMDNVHDYRIANHYNHNNPCTSSEDFSENRDVKEAIKDIIIAISALTQEQAAYVAQQLSLAFMSPQTESEECGDMMDMEVKFPSYVYDSCDEDVMASFIDTINDVFIGGFQ